jgi:hypothetical protein
MAPSGCGVVATVRICTRSKEARFWSAPLHLVARGLSIQGVVNALKATFGGVTVGLWRCVYSMLGARHARARAHNVHMRGPPPTDMMHHMHGTFVWKQLHHTSQHSDTHTE